MTVTIVLAGLGPSAGVVEHPNYKCVEKTTGGRLEWVAQAPKVLNFPTQEAQTDSSAGAALGKEELSKKLLSVGAGAKIVGGGFSSIKPNLPYWESKLSSAIDHLLASRVTGEHFTYYQFEQTPNELLGFPNPTDDTHTMGRSINKFTTQKLPMSEIEAAMKAGQQIKMIQVSPVILEDNPKRFGLASLEKIDFNHNPVPKNYNYGRPVFYRATTLDGQKTIVSAVVPGDDYFKHYVALVRYAVSTVLQYDAEKLITTISLPTLSANLVDHKELDKKFVKSGDIVVLGHVDDMEGRLKDKLSGMRQIDDHQNLNYGSKRFQLPHGSIVNFLGCKDSFWGGMAGDVAARCLDLEASQIIYVSKMGTLTKPDDIYGRIFSPTRFVRLNHTNTISEIHDVKNPLAERLGTGMHGSIPTIHEEDFSQRKKLDEFSANSIDNEISCIAERVSEHNARTGRNVPYLPLNFATDYLRKDDEIKLETPHDLSNNRTDSAKEKKEEILNRIAANLANYLCEHDEKLAVKGN